MLVSPIAHVEAIDLADLNRALVAWDHKMGPWRRPYFGRARFHGLFQNGELVAVTACDQLIAETCAGIPRDAAVELGRLCATRPGLCRVMLRMWREFVFPAFGREWAVSYQDAVLHNGNIYRFDGWVRLGTSSSGFDSRGGVRGRRKVIWGWAVAPDIRAARKAA